MPADQLTHIADLPARASRSEAQGWRQYNIGFAEPRTAEAIAARHLLPILVAAEDAGRLRCWWFIRKQPWKLRYLPGEHPGDGVMSDLLGELAAQGQITGWTTGIYEPEKHAFGGPEAIDVAHELFHHDSRCILDRVGRSGPALGRREMTVLLCSAMLRAAGLDWYEQGDVWAKVAALRPAIPVTPGRAAILASAMHRLMIAEPSGLGVAGRPLAGQSGWVTAFEHAGRALSALAQAGTLRRGLRAVLAHHIVFRANRAGLPIADQAILAALATTDVFGDPRGAASLPRIVPAEG